MAHPPRSNPPLRSSSGPPSPCITPSTETLVLVVSFMVGAPFSLVWSSFGRTVSQNLAHLLPPSIRVPSMVPGPLRMGGAAFAVSVGFLLDALVGHGEVGLPSHAVVVRHLSGRLYDVRAAETCGGAL